MKTKPIKVKIPRSVQQAVVDDLKRPHAHAYERVGFLFSKQVELDSHVLIMITEYMSVPDENYLVDTSVGAHIDSLAIRQAMQKVLSDNMGCFHVHLHPHSGEPYPSGTDKRSLPEVIQAFANINGSLIHGIVILSHDSIFIECKIEEQPRFIKPDLVAIIGYPMRLFYSKSSGRSRKTDIYERQSFLGKNAQSNFQKVRVGIIGYGGGGSHIGQQLAHLGVEQITVFDQDTIEATNLNRLIGGWFRDVKKSLKKVAIASRVIKNILPSAMVNQIDQQWQTNPQLIQECDIVFGCVDSYIGRQQLEAECRRFLIPYIDIGMDVFIHEKQPFLSGQVILSMPGMACMFCMGFLHEQVLAMEAAQYGAAGGRPQVVWANGTLASSAVGVFVDLVTGWSGQESRLVYQAYDENRGVLGPDQRLEYIKACNCEHYKLQDVGAPKFREL